MRTLGLVLLLSIAAFGKTMKNGDVVRMIDRGASVSEVISQINSAQAGFSLFPKDVNTLRHKGVPRIVIEAMSTRQTGHTFRLPAASLSIVASNPSKNDSVAKAVPSKPEQYSRRSAVSAVMPSPTSKQDEAGIEGHRSAEIPAKNRASNQLAGGSGSSKRVKIHGYVTAVKSESQFEIDDYKVNIDAHVSFEVEKSEDSNEPLAFTPDQFRVGDEVEIRGLLQKNTGQLTAESVKVNLDEHRRLKRTAVIEVSPKLNWVDGAPRGVVSADGQHIILDGSTNVFFRQNSSEKKELKEADKSHKPGDAQSYDVQAQAVNFEQLIGANTFISYEGLRQSDGTILARKVEFTKNELTSAESRLRRSIRPRVKIPKFDTGKSGELRVQNGKYKLVANQAIQQYIQNLGTSLVPQFQREMPDTDVQKIPFHFFVVAEQEPNAAAYPDGTVVVHSGLLTTLENEAQLAAVLSHEIAHAVQEHGYRQLQYHKNVRLAIAVGGAVGSIYGGRAVAELANMTEGAIRNGYQRSLENQADRLGMQYMISAGYDPREAPRVWKVMALKFGDHPTDFFWDSHDNNTTRRSYLMAELRNNYSNLDFASFRQQSTEFAALTALSVRPQSARHVIRLKRSQANSLN